jgi:hypothetical protein
MNKKRNSDISNEIIVDEFEVIENQNKNNKKSSPRNWPINEKNYLKENSEIIDLHSKNIISSNAYLFNKTSNKQEFIYIQQYETILNNFDEFLKNNPKKFKNIIRSGKKNFFKIFLIRYTNFKNT